jgi:peptidyl-prolyl cis-trans isomerase B (cyclophilin B)
MKKEVIITILVAILLIAGMVGYALYNNQKTKKPNNNENKTENTVVSEKEENTVSEENKEEDKVYSKGKHHAEMVIKDYGTIALELDADVAPITVENFAQLVNEGFYNGLTFHRIISGFMIQGGDPQGTGMGGSDKEIKGEFAANGVKNNISHTRGVISMARATAYDSASSQFFIVHQDSKFLDGNYAGFGRVTSGIEIVDKICANTKVEDNNGTVLKANQPIIEKITMID